jgi:hypothetical protein
MFKDMTLAGLAAATKSVYLRAVYRLSTHYRRSPTLLSAEEVRSYNNNIGGFLERSSLALSAVVTLATLGWLLWRSHYGLDFTDESSHLIWIVNPWIYKVSPYLYGYIYHPLYLLVAGDIAQLRQGNMLITFGLAWLLCFTLFRVAFKTTASSETIPRSVTSVLSAALAISAFLLFNLWLTTPSYNSLAFQSLLIAGIGLLLAEKNYSGISLAGWGLIGFSGWLAFMAKPTTAAGLGFIAVLYLVAAAKLNFRLLVLSSATAAGLMLCSALAIDGSILGFAERLKNGAESYAKLSESYAASGILRWDWDRQAFDREEKLVLACSTLLVFVTVYLSFSSRATSRSLSIIISTLAALVGLVLTFGLLTPSLKNYPFKGLLIWAVPLGTLLAALVKYRENVPSLLTRDGIVIALCFASFPHVYAFGTDNNYWWAASSAGIFWGLAGAAILAYANVKPISWRMFLPIAAAAQLTTIVILYISMEYPYRQTQPLRQNDQVIAFGADQVKIILARDYADYVLLLRRAANGAGFERGTPMIDMTGHYPGALYSLGARSIGRSWINGGYKGSEAFAISMLDLVPCSEIAQAWILAEDDGPKQLPMEMLKRYGIDVQHDYAEVGTLMSPKGRYRESYKQRLLKPKRSSEFAVGACKRDRHR